MLFFLCYYISAIIGHWINQPLHLPLPDKHVVEVLQDLALLHGPGFKSSGKS